MNEDELLELCKKAKLTVFQTEVVFGRLIQQTIKRPYFFSEIAEHHGCSVQRASQVFQIAMGKIERIIDDQQKKKKDV
jgi:hypothetical protein